MAQPSAFGFASLYDPSIATDQTALDRQMEMAKLLRAQSMMGLDPNRQIGGMGYKISPLEVIGKMMQGYASTQMDAKNDEARQGLATKQSQALAGALRGMFGDAPATGQTQVPSPYEDSTPSAVNPASAPVASSPTVSNDNPRKRAALSAMLMGNTELANKLIANELEQTPFMKDAAYKGIDPKQFGAAELAAEKAKGVLNVSPGNTLYEPGKGAVFEAPEKAAPDVKALNEALSGSGIDPKSPEGRKVFAELVRKQVTFPPANTVTVNADKTYTGNVAEGLAKQELGMVESARQAPDRIAGAQRIKEILSKNPITGTGADKRLAFDKALATAGFKSGDRAATTESLASELAGSTLDAVKTSGLGAGQGFTDKDREFLEKAKSGNIEMTSTTLGRLADLNEKSARATIERANSVIKKWQKNPSMQSMGFEEIAVPGSLSAAEQAELEDLRKRLGKK